MAFTIGCDVEVFAKNKDGHHVALCGKIGGTKEKPLQVKGMEDGFCVQEDNVAIEFNIPPANLSGYFVKCVSLGLKNAQDYLPKGLELSKKSSVIFDKEELSHKKALVFGCEPDYDAWKLIENSKPQAQNPLLRTAGGHVHVGTSKPMIKVAQNLDLFLGVPSIILDNNEEARQRRELYGKAGAMRPKPYGLEYRVLSNFWVFRPELVRWVFDNTYSAILYTATIKKSMEKAIINCINTGDVKDAEDICKHFGVTYPTIE